MRVTRVTPWLLSLTVSLGLVVGASGSGAQGEPSIGIDADSSGNTASSLGPIDPCISVKKGDTFKADIYVADVVNFSAWEIYFDYDPSVVTIVDREVELLLAASPGSDVFDASETLPTTDRLYRLAAADLSLPHAPESGSGVLARLTLRAVASGVSPANIGEVDLDGDGKIDLGPLLTDDQGKQIGPTSAAGFFGGPIANAVIAVDRTCEETTPGPAPTMQGTPFAASSTPEASPQRTSTTPAGASTTATPPTPAATPTVSKEEEGGEGPPWVIASVAGGVVGALALIGGAAFFLRSRRGRRR